jgi:hypothetical protein
MWSSSYFKYREKFYNIEEISWGVGLTVQGVNLVYSCHCLLDDPVKVRLLSLSFFIFAPPWGQQDETLI